MSQSAITRVGKIAALPAIIREELNRRMMNGELSPTLLPWLNGLDEVKSVLAQRFDGEPITRSNLSDWRQGGFRDWLQSNERVQQVGELSRLAAELARANGGRLADGAQAIMGGRILEVLEASVTQLDLDTLAKVVGCLTSLRSTEIAQQRADQGREKLRQNDEALKLEREKFEHQFFSKLLQGALLARAQEIAASGLDNEKKIAALREFYFADVDALQKSGEVKLPD